MATLRSFFVQAEAKKIRSGEVIRRSANNEYTVQMDGREINCRVETGTDISSGTRVVLAKADEGHYIVSQEKLRGSRAIERVVING